MAKIQSLICAAAGKVVDFKDYSRVAIFLLSAEEASLQNRLRDVFSAAAFFISSLNGNSADEAYCFF